MRGRKAARGARGPESCGRRDCHHGTGRKVGVGLLAAEIGEVTALVDGEGAGEDRVLMGAHRDLIDHFRLADFEK